MQNDKPRGGSGLAGLVLSSMGVVGWLAVVITLAPYEPGSIQRVLAFTFNAIVLVAGGGTSSALALSGLVASAVSNSHERTTQATVGTVLGAVGLIAGLVIFSWRWHLVFG